METVQTEDTRFVRDIHSKALLTTDRVALDIGSFAMAANNDDTGTGMVTGDSGHQTVVAVGSLKFSFTGASSNSVTDTIIGSAMIIGDLA